jgi:uncharacterized membrane protein
MNDQREPKRVAPQRLMQFALLGSLGLNLFFAGWGLGVGLRPPPPGRGGPFGGLEHELRGRLSPDGMSKVESLIGDIDAGFRREFGASDSIRQELHAVLIAEPFSSNDFMRTLGQLNARRTDFDSTMARRIAEFVAGLSPEDRRIFADAVLRMPPGPLG